MISKIVDNLRCELQLTDPVNLDIIIDSISDLKIKYGVTNVYDGAIKKDDINGKYIIEIASEKCDLSKRDRFTIAHELGHLLLGHVDQYPTLYREGENELEYEANKFAAELLMPKKEFLESVHNNVSDGGLCDLEKVAGQFDVSISAAQTRGRFLGVFKW